LKHFVYLGLRIYYKLIKGPYNVK
jgi:hypothetical protein